MPRVPMPPRVDVPLPLLTIVLHRLSAVQYVSVEYLAMHDLATEVLELEVMVGVAHHRVRVLTSRCLNGFRPVSSSVIVSSLNGS
jgi:hypothetical protein